MKHNHQKFSYLKWLLPVLVFLIGGSILHVIAHTVRHADYERLRAKAELNAVTYANQMTDALYNGIGITDSLEQILISEDGNIDKFDVVAQHMMADYVQSIQLAPNGVVTEIYPEAGNEAGKIDLIHDETRGDIVNYGIDNNIVVMQGPFELKQGGQGIAIRNPVFLQDESGNKTFWGLTIVIIRVPDIFIDSVNALTNFGYEYSLSKTPSPLTDEFKVIDHSGAELADPVSYTFELGGCTWQLDVMPKDGWQKDKKLPFIFICGGCMILLLETLTIAFLIMREQRRKFRQLSLTDGLTGLLNRTGFDEQADSYLRKSDVRFCVGILLDVDNFKFINDMYGHAVGDRVLQQLADSMRKAFPENAILGRNGGDEFCIILKDCNVEEARPRIEAFSNSSRTFESKGQTHNYGISIGYAEYPTHAEKISDLLRYADMALYEVKLGGKHSCLCYKSSFHTSKRTQLGFELDDISSNLPGAFFIYKADKSDERILFANREMIHLTGCNDLDDFMQFTDRKFSNLVHPEDYTKIERSIWDQIESHRDGDNDYVKYRLATKDGSYKTVLDFGRIVESEYYGSVFYVLIVDCDYIDSHYDSF